jgi:phytoene desaturase
LIIKFISLSKKIQVIGGGFSSLVCASVLSKQGYDVTLFEKNSTLGGRARKMEIDGFVFDMGPSWYWMPEVFENYFTLFGKEVSDYYKLVRLDPSYRIYYNDSQSNIPANYDQFLSFIETIEKGSSVKMNKFLDEAKYKYEVGMNEFVWKPSKSIFEFIDFKVFKSVFRIQLFSPISKHIRSFFKNEKLIQLLEFPSLFLGAKPSETPALYSLMNYADIKLGTWYPLGGMYKVIEGLIKVAKDSGVKFVTSAEVTKIQVENNRTTGVYVNEVFYPSDLVISGADYHHTDKHLLEESNSNYTEKNWQKKVLAPSCLLFYIGINKRLNNIEHHNLFFDTSFDKHAQEIYDKPMWPDNPLFYMCAPSVTDSTVAPSGCENIFLLVPIAPDLEDNEEIRSIVFDKIIKRLEKRIRQSVVENIIVKKSYSIKDFKADYHSYKGNAYGLANTLMQTAFLKPKLQNKKVKNLFYTGQLTTPGPGVPPCIISGQVAAKEIIKYLQNQTHNERVV